MIDNQSVYIDLSDSIDTLRDEVRSVAGYAGLLKDCGEPPDDWGELVRVFVEIGDLIGELREAQADVGEAAHHALPAREVHVEHIGQVEKAWGNQRSAWQHDELFSRVLAASRDERKVDEETGEFESEVVTFLRVLKDCAGIGYWKVGDADKGTGLRGRGLEPDEFCTTKKKRVSITVPSAAKRALASVRGTVSRSPAPGSEARGGSGAEGPPPSAPAPLTPQVAEARKGHLDAEVAADLVSADLTSVSGSGVSGPDTPKDAA